MGGKTELERVVAYVPPASKQELEAWAEAEERSVSWLVAKLIDRALQERGQALARQDPAQPISRSYSPLPTKHFQPNQGS